MTTEIVYLGHDNTIDLLLKRRVPPSRTASAIDLTPVTKITVTIGGVLVDSDDSGAPILWAESSYETGEVRIDASGYSIPSGLHTDCPIIVYDTTNTDGIVWDHVNIEVVADQEGS